ncbi:hypothetical protein JYU02_00350 [bacterium AH-315-P15]|nr:hypothetical protein [bacterium AH-315-P15]
MRWTAGVVLGASALLGACATQAIGDEITIDSEKENGHVVRMVIDRMYEDGDETTRMCVFVPAGDEAAGALSCSGDDVRVIEFGGGHGRQIIIDGDVVFDEAEIRTLINERLAVVSERLAGMGDLHIEFVEEFNSEEFQREMTARQAEMAELHREMRLEFRDHREMTPEERAEFDAEMAEFAGEMREFDEVMAEMQAEVMVGLAEQLAELESRDIVMRRGSPGHHMRWFGGPDGDHMGRNIIRIEQDGIEHITIIEHGKDEDGNPRLVIRTTDPSSVEVIQIDADELRVLDE